MSKAMSTCMDGLDVGTLGLLAAAGTAFYLLYTAITATSKRRRRRSQSSPGGGDLFTFSTALRDLFIQGRTLCINTLLYIYITRALKIS